MDADTKRGRGTAEGQFLELFDGGGNTSYGVVAGARHYDASMVSVFGNIQPDALTELINGKDATGKFARLLCVKVPLVGLNLRCLLYTSPSPRDGLLSRMPSSA